MGNSAANTYLDQVVGRQAELEGDLRSRKSSSSADAASPRAKRPSRVRLARDSPRTGPVDIRVTGFGPWKTVLVPPNAFVVHTRRGQDDPMHLGLGRSFPYNPWTDSYLVVPGAIQTILINAYCICSELQGVVVQGYVQWIVQDFATAYRKLDFSDTDDPMRLVNIQLREQAEAAIKDTVSTMGMRDVLSDKQPIIEELTARLRAVAEGSGDGDEGLGLRIVTVQIKEAVVSSNTLWENLQKPYRSEQNRIAKLAEIEAQEVISVREVAASRAAEERRLENEGQLEQLRAKHESARFDRDAVERLRRTTREHEDERDVARLAQETLLNTLRLERDQHAERSDNARLRFELQHLELDGELALAEARSRAHHDQELLALDRERLRVANANDQNVTNIQAQLIEALPAIVAKLPTPAELKSVHIGGDHSTLNGVIAQLSAILDALKPQRAPLPDILS